MEVLMIILLVLFVISLIQVTWTYIGYPAFLFLISSVFGKKHSVDDSYMPHVSLLIIAHNEENVIRKKIENSLNLDYPKDRMEIIVIDDGSNDRTREIVREYEKFGVKLIEQNPRRGKASAINLGLKSAKGEVIIVTDANSMFDRDAVRKIARHFHDPAIGAVGGRYEPRVSEATDIALGNLMYWKFERIVRERESLLDSVVGMNGNIMAIRKGIIEKVDEDLLTEDFDITVSLREKGFRVLYEPEAFSWKLAPKTLRDEIIQKRRRVVGTIQTLLRHKSVLLNPKYGWYGMLILPSHKLFQMIVPFFFALLIASSSCLHLMTDLVLAHLVFYLLSAFLLFSTISILLLRLRPRTKLLLFSLSKYFFIQHYDVLLGWWDYLRGNYKVTWEKAESTRDLGGVGEW
jgi:cellulose synthase/poly-beta-1,6-N-acetylglucosamine synthase-like glycosyltransferase